MRTLAVILMIAGVPVASASAQTSGRIEVVKPDASTLRGSVGETTSESPLPRGDLSGLVPAPLPVRPIASPAPTDGGQCRRSCVRDYYFCLSAEDEATCSPIWVKCQARCGG